MAHRVCARRAQSAAARPRPALVQRRRRLGSPQRLGSRRGAVDEPGWRLMARAARPRSPRRAQAQARPRRRRRPRVAVMVVGLLLAGALAAAAIAGLLTVTRTPAAEPFRF